MRSGKHQVYKNKNAGFYLAFVEAKMITRAENVFDTSPWRAVGVSGRRLLKLEVIA